MGIYNINLINSTSGNIDMSTDMSNPKITKIVFFDKLNMQIANGVIGRFYNVELSVGGRLKTLSLPAITSANQSFSIDIKSIAQITMTANIPISIRLENATGIDYSLSNTIELTVNLETPPYPTATTINQKNILLPIVMSESFDGADGAEFEVAHPAGGVIYTSGQIKTGSATVPAEKIRDTTEKHFRFYTWWGATTGGEYKTTRIGTKMVVKDLVSSLPSIRNLKANSTNIENPIIFTWECENQGRYNIVITQGGIEKKNETIITSATSYTVPANMFSVTEEVVVKLKAAYSATSEHWSNVSEYRINPTVTMPTVENLTILGNYWEKPIRVNWRSSQQTSYEYELYYDNAVIKSGTGGIEKEFVIAANTFTGTLPASVRVRVSRTVNGQTLWSNWAERNISLQDVTATISNLLVNGDQWEKPINVSWQSVDQQQFKLEILSNNVVTNTFTGGAETQFTIPAETMLLGVYVIRIFVGYGNRFVNSQSKSLTTKDIVPTISNLSLSGSNVDLALTLSWDSTDQEAYKITATKGGVVEFEEEGTTDKLKAFTPNTFTAGLYTFKVDVSYKNRVRSMQINASLVETFPSIGVLEPDGVMVERDEPLRVWWTSQNQTKWNIIIDNTLTYSGTDEKELILPAATLQTDNHTLVLTVIYVTENNLEKPVSKTAEFIVQGRPPTPTITIDSNITVSRPTITWDTQDQQGYTMEVLNTSNDVIYSTGWNNGLVDEYKVADYLADGTYIARVKIMNRYELESDWGVKQFTISTGSKSEITLNSLVVKNYVELTWDNPNDEYVKFYIIRNGNVIASTLDTKYDDFTAHKECIYAIKGVNMQDSYKDSNESYEIVNIRRSVVSTLSKLDDMLEIVVMTNDNMFSANLSNEHSLVHLSGRVHPVSIFGDHKTDTYDLTLTCCEDLYKFIEMYNRREAFCYRDNLEKIFFTVPSLPYNRDSRALDFDSQIAATRIDYEEVVDYD